MAFRSSARPKLATALGFDSPARAELALALAERDAYETTVAENEGAAARIEEVTHAAYTRQTAADKALADALAGAHARTVAQMMANETICPDPIIEASRAIIRECEGVLLAVRDAKAEITAKRGRYPMTRMVQDDAVKAAAAKVLAESPILPDLITRVLHFQTNLGESARLLTWAFKTGALALPPAKEAASDTPVHKALRTVLSQMNYHATALGLPAEHPRFPSPLTEWQEAFAALQKDATAPLPERV